MSGRRIHPGVTARRYVWKDLNRSTTPGIALWGKAGMAAWLTYTDARVLADRLHDMADKLEAEGSN